ncbi:MAG: hypothetical protein HY332_13360 [Chloroflexi bacterium]|nr:hypothetical protein [Chloroflexota bacterium]
MKRYAVAVVVGLAVAFSSVVVSWQPAIPGRRVPAPSDALANGARRVAPADDSTPAPRVAQAVVQVSVRPPEVLPPQQIRVEATAEHPAYWLFTPEGPAEPRKALLVLHGMGGNGLGIGSTSLAFAQANNLVVIAPTMPYGDWRDPNQLVAEELRLLPQLTTLLDAVPAETGVPLTGRVYAFGFSRGAQEALRFALLYPDRVRAVAAMSAGTYTLPTAAVKTAAGASISAPLPYGIADLEQRTGRPVNHDALTHVRFFIGVGAGDNRDGDVPRQWDPFVGNNRVERAVRFGDVLAQLGCQTQVEVVPGTGHELNAAMMERVTAFLTWELAVELQEADGLPPSELPSETYILHRSPRF